MKLLIWTTIWSLFIASLLGMVLSALLASSQVRALVVDLWFRSANAAERGAFQDRTSALFRAFAKALLLASSGQPSPWKTLLWALLAALLLFGATLFAVFPSKVGTGIEPPPLVAAMYPITAILVHWFVEFRFSKVFIRAYQAAASKPTTRPFLFSAGRAGIDLVRSALILTGICACLALMLSVLRSQGTEWSTLVYLYDAIAGLSVANAPTFTVIYVGTMLLTGTAVSSKAVLLLLLSLCTSFAVAFLYLLSILFINNRFSLRALAWVSGALDGFSPRTVFAVSLTLFTISTGLMQAATFPAR